MAKKTGAKLNVSTMNDVLMQANLLEVLDDVAKLNPEVVVMACLKDGTLYCRTVGGNCFTHLGIADQLKEYIRGGFVEVDEETDDNV